MKLKCTEHNRRVMILDNAKTLHRSDGTECKSPRVTIAEQFLTPHDVANWDDVPLTNDIFDVAAYRLGPTHITI